MGLRAIKKLAALGHKHVALSNRSETKLNRIAEKYGIKVIPFKDWKSYLSQVDILMMATSSETYLLDQTDITPEIIVDLGIPRNINPNVAENKNVELIALFDLQKIADDTIDKRKKELTKISDIIAEEKSKLDKWMSFKTSGVWQQKSA
jgi:glutamyl-tRNA reductase